MTDSLLNIDTEDERWSEAVADINKTAEKVKSAVFSYVGEHTDDELLHGGKKIVVNLCLSNDEHVHELNKEFRGIDKATNVLSFANLDFEDFKAESELFGEIELGDIIIAYETMQREAVAEKISLHDHFCHLLTHGILHLLGFDHIEDKEAEYMESFEIAILQSLKIANPYKEN